MAPVRQRGDDQSIEIRNDRVHRFASSGRAGWQFRFQIAGFDCGEDGKLVDMIEVIGDPVDQIMAQPTKVFLIHVAEFRTFHESILATKSTKSSHEKAQRKPADEKTILCFLWAAFVLFVAYAVCALDRCTEIAIIRG